MEIAEKIHLVFDDVDEERLASIARTCSEMVTSLRLDLAFCKKDQHKLKIIQSKQKEAQDKIKEFAIRSQYAVNLYNQHLDIEFKKVSKGQPFNIPLILDETSIFRVEIVRSLGSDEEFNEMDHVECALTNALKVCTESILWTTYYSELEGLEREIKEEAGVDKKNELAENTSSVKQSGEEATMEKRDETVVPIIEPLIQTKFQQIFKKRGAELFDYLQSEYSLDDQSPVAKYSYIYHFLSYEQLIIARCQSKYMEFIKETFGVTMSKILSENDKFSDDIHPLLSRLKSNFERKAKLEQNRNEIE